MPAKIPMNANQLRYSTLFAAEPATRINNITIPFSIDGPFDLEAVRFAATCLLSRHNLLRSVLPESLEPAFDVVDVDDAAAASIRVLKGSGEILERLTRAAEQLHLREESLPRKELFRFAVLPPAGESWGLILSASHLISDGVSIRLLVREFGTLYEGQLRNTPVTLSPAENSHDAVVSYEATDIRKNADCSSELARSIRPFVDRNSSILRTTFSPASRISAPMPADLWRSISDTAKGRGLRLSTPFLAALIGVDASGECSESLVKIVRADRPPDFAKLVSNFIDLALVFWAGDRPLNTSGLRRLNSLMNQSLSKPVRYWPMCREHFPTYYHSPYGVSPTELSILLPEGEFWYDGELVKLRRDQQTAQNLSTWAQSEICLQVQPNRDGDGRIHLLYNKDRICSRTAADQLQMIVDSMKDFADP